MKKIILAVAFCATTLFATDLTTYNSSTDTGRIPRYLTTIGAEIEAWSFGTTIYNDWSANKGFVDFTSYTGNGPGPDSGNRCWLQINDGVTNANQCCTFNGDNPDYFGYIFKRPATVTNIVFWNWIYVDGGTFSNAPNVQILNTRTGAWQDISSSCSPTYDTSLVPSSVSRKYVITPSIAQQNICGIRLIGGAQPASSGDPEGFVGVSELQLNGYIESALWKNVILTNNLALAANGATAIMGPGATQTGNPGNINDGILNTREQTWNSNLDDYVGVIWSNKTINGISAVGLTFRTWGEGGWFTTNGGTDLEVQYSTDKGANWTDYSSVDFGGYLADYSLYPLDQCFGYLFTFGNVGEINAIRVYGDPGGTADQNGFVSLYEFETFQAIPEPFSLIVLTGVALLVLRRKQVAKAKYNLNNLIPYIHFSTLNLQFCWSPNTERRFKNF